MIKKINKCKKFFFSYSNIIIICFMALFTVISIVLLAKWKGNLDDCVLLLFEILVVFAIAALVLIIILKKRLTPITNLIDKKKLLNELDIEEYADGKNNDVELLEKTFTQLHSHILRQRYILKRKLIKYIIYGDFTYDIQENLNQLGVMVDKDCKYGIFSIKFKSKNEDVSERLEYIENLSREDCQLHFVMTIDNETAIFLIVTKDRENIELEFQNIKKKHEDDLELKFGGMYNTLANISNSYFNISDIPYFNFEHKIDNEFIDEIAELIKTDKIYIATKLINQKYGLSDFDNCCYIKKKHTYSEFTAAVMQICSKFDLNLTANDVSALLSVNNIVAKKKVSEIFFKCNELINEDIQTEDCQIMSERTKDILRYIDENFTNQDMCLDLICEKYKIHHNTLSAIFKKETGQNYKDYLTEKRISAAKTMLVKQPDLTVTQIGTEVGYRNISYFIKCFKDEVGVTPNIFKKKVSDKTL